jgi:hypothetical protein
MKERRPGRRWLPSPTSKLTRAGRARRRYNCARQEEWGERAEAAVALLATHEERCRAATAGAFLVADLGAGNERLRTLLEARLEGEVEYHPYDLHPQLPTTARLDAAGEMPAGEFDVTICLGLLEYLPSVTDLAKRLAGATRFALISYVTSDSPVAMTHEQRLNHGWTTHLKASEVEAAFAESGFDQIASAKAEGEITTLWLWENAAVERMR